METVFAFIVLVALGLLVGVLSGLLGIGGGLILVPTFKLLFALEAIVATATSLFTIIPTSIAGAVVRIRKKTCVPKLGIVMGIGGAITSPLGVWLASVSPGWLIMLAAALVIGYSAFKMLRKALAMPTDCAAGQSASPAAGASAADPTPAAGAPVPASAPGEFAFAIERKHLGQALFIGCVAGVASGYIGLGGGFLMVPLMVTLLDMPMKYASGTSLIGIMILAIPGVMYQGFLGNVEWVLGLAMAIGAVPGATLGARLASRLPERKLRLAFGVMLLLAAVLLVFDELGILG